MSKQLVVAASVVAALLSAGCSTIPEDFPEMAVYGPESDFVFRGRVRILHTSTIDSPDAETMGVVRVVDIVHSPQSLASTRGRDVTVQFAEIGSVSPADDLLLFTNIAVLGDEVGLMEVASLPWDEARLTTTALQEEWDRAMDDQSDAALREQVRSAEVVVFGAVMRTTPLKVEGARDTEHDPMWTEAVVQVEEQMKGEPVESVTFVFSSSTDIAWFAAPKIREGDRGVFLLRTRENVTHMKDTLALIHKTEFRADKAEIDRIREHAKGIRP